MGIPDFESSAFGHSANFPVCGCKVNVFSLNCKIYSKDNLFNLSRSRSASDLRIANLISQVLSYVCETMRGDMSFITRMTSLVIIYGKLYTTSSSTCLTVISEWLMASAAAAL